MLASGARREALATSVSLPRACPVCGHDPCELRGVVLHAQPPRVAGVAIDLGGEEFRLWRCPECAFQFKHPNADPGALMECYRRSAVDHWEIDPDPGRRQFDVIRTMVERYAPRPTPERKRCVLDVGCGNGALLGAFGPDWERDGIEPGVAAARLARERGVAILGAALDDVDAGARWDAVLAIDVVEHISKPVTFFERIAGGLRPGGILILLTGDTAAPSWRLQGSRYWYCSLVEHESFLCRRTLDWIGAKCGLAMVSYERRSHIRVGAAQRISETVKNLGFAAAQRVGWLPGRWLRDHVLDRRAPGWVSARDHMLCAMRRVAAGAERVGAPGA